MLNKRFIFDNKKIINNSQINIKFNTDINIGEIYDKITYQINSLIKDLYNASEKYFMKKKSLCFQLIAFDIQVDENHNIYVLECNDQPSYTIDNNPDILIEMFTEAFNIVKNTYYNKNIELKNYILIK